MTAAKQLFSLPIIITINSLFYKMSKSYEKWSSQFSRAPKNSHPLTCKKMKPANVSKFLLKKWPLQSFYISRYSHWGYCSMDFHGMSHLSGTFYYGPDSTPLSLPHDWHDLHIPFLIYEWLSYLNALCKLLSPDEGHWLSIKKKHSWSRRGGNYSWIWLLLIVAPFQLMT